MTDAICVRCRTKLPETGGDCQACEPIEKPAGNKHYVNGRAFELRVKKKLEAEGWTVFRSAGSKSPADLIAVRGQVTGTLWRVVDHSTGKTVQDGDLYEPKVYEPRLRLVQCKSGRTPMPRKERQAFKEFAEALGAEAVVYLKGMKEEAA